MALTLKVPTPAERQLTESKWESGEEALRIHPVRTVHTVLETPNHVYTVVRETDGSFSRVRTKSQEETNSDVDLASPLGTRRVLSVLVGSAPDTTGTGM